MKVYLDNSVVSAIPKDDTAKESPALRQVHRLFKDGKLDLWTSKVSEGEIAKYEDEGRRKLVEDFYNLLKDVAYFDVDQLLYIAHAWDPYGGQISSPVFDPTTSIQSLLSIRLDQTDSHHLMVAIRAQCDVFLTCDRRILCRESLIREQFSIRVMSPSELIEELGDAPGFSLGSRGAL